VLHWRPTYLAAGINGPSICKSSRVVGSRGIALWMLRHLWLTQACVAFLDLFSNVCTPGIEGRWFKYLGAWLLAERFVLFNATPSHFSFTGSVPIVFHCGKKLLVQNSVLNCDYDTWGSTAKRGVLAFYLHFWWQYMTKEFVLDIFTLFWTRLDKRRCGTVRDGAGRCGIWRISFPRDCVMVNGFFLGQFFKIKTRFQLLQLISKRERGRWRR